MLPLSKKETSHFFIIGSIANLVKESKIFQCYIWLGSRSINVTRHELSKCNVLFCYGKIGLRSQRRPVYLEVYPNN